MRTRTATCYLFAGALFFPRPPFGGELLSRPPLPPARRVGDLFRASPLKSTTAPTATRAALTWFPPDDENNDGG